MRRQFKVRCQFVAGGLQKHRSKSFGPKLFSCLNSAFLLPLFFFLSIVLTNSNEAGANETVVKAQSASEIRGTVETKQEDGFARIVFKFNHLPKHSYALEDGILVLRFEEPVKVNVSRVAERLNRYVGIARLDPDGRSIRFALTQSYRTNLMAAGELLFLDIMPSNWVGLPPPLPDHVVAELADRVRKSDAESRKRALQRREAQGDIKLKIRVARFPTFSRITFEWNQFTTVDFSRRDKNVVVAFDALTDIDLGLLKTDPPRYVQDAKAETGPDGVKVSMQISPEADVRGFREGNNFVVDLTGPDSDIEIATKKLQDELDREKGLKTSAGKPQPGTKLDGEIKPDMKPGEVDRDIVKEAFLSTTRPFKFHDLDPVKFGDWSIDMPRTANATEEQGATRSQKKTELDPVKARTTPKSAAENSSRPEPVKTEPGAQQQANDSSEFGEMRSVKAEISKIGSALKLKFPFAAETSAAVFRRGRIVWLVFDSPDLIDFSGIKDHADPVIADIQQNQVGRRSIVRLKLQQPWLTHTSKKETTWIVQIGNMVTGAANTLNLQRSLRGDKKSIVTVKMPGAGRVHWIDDPQIGDRLGVVTAFSPVRNISKPQEFVEFSVLPSTHGLVVRPKTDDLAVRLVVDEILITRNQGLALSPGTAHQYVAGRKALDKKNNSRAGFLDFRNWQKGGVRSFQANQSRLEKEIAAAKPKDRNAQRLQLARLYLAHMLVPESLGVIRQITEDDQGAESDPAINILRGAASVSMGYLTDAEKDLNVHALAHDADAALWRGLLHAQQQNWSDAVKNFKDGQSVVSEYPSEIQGQFQLANAKSAIELRKLAVAADVLDSLSKVKLADHQFGENQLLRGRYLDAIGRTEEAIEAYKAAIKSDIAPVAAEAEYRLVNLLVRNNKISHADALKRLERLSIVWRGDDTELRTLRLLANLYVRDKDYRSAFSIMKNAVKAFPQDKLSLSIQDEMKEIFVDLFVHDRGRNLQPIEALSLYYDYRELTPIGRLGDEMIRRLADRLISVDLLDQAAELLQHQVDKRLTGVARAQVATRLAMVQLMNRNPIKALSAIRHTRQPDLPKLLRRDRDILEARALGDIGRVEGAVDILNRLEGPEIERLKADAYWSAQQWLPAGQQLEKMLDQRWQDSAPLTDEERFNVLRAAISYVLAKDQFALDRLRKKFYPKMIKTIDAEAFVLVSNPVVGKSLEIQKLAKEIAGVDTLDAFMKKFKLRYSGGSFMPDSAKTEEAEKPDSLG